MDDAGPLNIRFADVNELTLTAADQLRRVRVARGIYPAVINASAISAAKPNLNMSPDNTNPTTAQRQAIVRASFETCVSICVLRKSSNAMSATYVARRTFQELSCFHEPEYGRRGRPPL